MHKDDLPRELQLERLKVGGAVTVVLSLFNFGAVIPALVSMANTFAVIGGGLLIWANLYLVYYLVNKFKSL